MAEENHRYPSKKKTTKKDNKKTKAFYDWATTGTPVTIEYLTPGATLKAGTTERWNGAMVQWRTGAMADGGK